MKKVWFEEIVEQMKYRKDQGHGLDPKNPIEPNDHYIGEIPDTLKNLFRMAIKYEKDAEETILAAKYSSDEAVAKGHRERANEILIRRRFLFDAFWVSVRDLYNLWDKGSIGIRKGWKVVWSDPSSDPLIKAFEDLLCSSIAACGRD